METEKKADRLAYSWHIFLHTQDLIKLADNKIRYLFLVSSISATFILTESNTLEVINAWEVLFIISFVLFLAFASLTIKPRTSKSGGTNIPKLIFHNDITSKADREAYSSEFRNASDQELEDDLLFQIYEIASIAEKKYKYYNYSFYTLCIQILFFFLVLI